MKVLSVKKLKSETSVTALDMFVDSGYLQGPNGSLPDVDCDYQSNRRQEVKAYYETRYNHDGKQRVFSAGTMTTLKAKAVITDVARTMRIPIPVVKYMTAIIQDDKSTYTDLFKLAATSKRFNEFVTKYPRLFENIRTIMFQPRSSSIHASALLVTPDTKDGKDMECFDFVPIKKIDGVLVSENDGYELDELGLLKNDCLSTKELSKLQETFALCNKEYNANVSLESIVTGPMDDQKVYEMLSEGYTQNVFQFSSKGMTRFVKDLRPSCIGDLIAANALFRPATLENGSVDNYINCKNGIVAPVYLWGTYNALKETYGQITYQEQMVRIAREIGGLSLSEGVKLVKFISKKKIDKIKHFEGKFKEGAEKNGCPKDDANAIWAMIESGGKYLFNKSHATAYAMTSYVGAYLKAKYPTAFYTVALQWADDKELSSIMSEMEICSKARVATPDINESYNGFHTDYATDKIYWSLSRIKFVGVSASQWIIDEREKNGKFSSIEEFIDRVFKYKLKIYKYWDDPDNEEEAQKCPVNARAVKNFILAGCFDKIENVGSVVERFAILKKAAERLGFELLDSDFPVEMIGKHYYWTMKQIEVSGIGAVDYRRIYDSADIKAKLRGRVAYTTIKGLEPMEMDRKHVGMCANIVEIEEKKFTSKKDGETKTFCKLTLQQGNDLTTCIIWPEEYEPIRDKIYGSKGKIVVFSAQIKFSDFAGKNELQFYRNSLIEIK